MNIDTNLMLTITTGILLAGLIKYIYILAVGRLLPNSSVGYIHSGSSKSENLTSKSATK